MRTCSNLTLCMYDTACIDGVLTKARRALTLSTSRPHTPPFSQNNSRNTNASPSRKANSRSLKLSSRGAHDGILNGKSRDWSPGGHGDEDHHDDHFDYDFNEDEDEFGLPSIANSRRKARRAAGSSIEALGIETHSSDSLFNFLSSSTSGRARANSSDIAEERGTPSYPMARKVEGKILRPQYKDILKGMRWIE